VNWLISCTDCRTLRRAIAADDDASHVELTFPSRGRWSHGFRATRDHGVGAVVWNGRPQLRFWSVCSFWIENRLARRPQTAPMMGCRSLFSSFAAQDDPAAWDKRLSLGGRSSPYQSSRSYLFAMLPRVSNVEMLIAALAPSFLVFGVPSRRRPPATAFVGLATGDHYRDAAGVAVDLQRRFLLGVLANTGVSLVIGMATAAVMTRLTRSVGGRMEREAV